MALFVFCTTHHLSKVFIFVRTSGYDSPHMIPVLASNTKMKPDVIVPHYSKLKVLFVYLMYWLGK